MENNKTIDQGTKKPKKQKQKTTKHAQQQSNAPKPNDTQDQEYKNPTQPTSHTYRLEDFLPLIIIFASIIAFTLIRQWYEGWNLLTAMFDFMGSFFLVFGAFKVMNLKGFVEAYSIYDIFAKQYRWYGYLYPFLEVGLGVSYLMHFAPWWVNLFTFALMTVSSIGVAQELLAKREIACACLGAVFKIPMTWVTLAEDLVMAAMALWMLFL